jgi:hypothetical protein
MVEIDEKELRAVRDSIQLLQKFEEKQKITLLHKRGVSSFFDSIQALTKKDQLQQYIQSNINDAIAPMKQQLSDILFVLQQKPISSGAGDIKFAPATPARNIEQEVDKKLEQVGKQWEKVSETPEMVVMKYGEHLLTIYADSNGNKMANVDNGKNEAIKSDNQLAAIKKKIEGM